MSDVMIKLKKTYYSAQLKDNKVKINFAKSKLDDSYCADAFINKDGKEDKYAYIAAYSASEKNGKLVSNSGSFPIQYDLNMLRSMLKDSDSLLSYNKYIYLCLASILVTKSMDINNSIGATSNTMVNGTMNKKGLFFGTSDPKDGNKIFGTENMWSRNWIILDYIYQKSNKIYKKKSGDSSDLESYYIVDTPNLIFEKGYISKLAGSNEFIGPKEVNGSSTTYTTAYSVLENDPSAYKIYNILIGGSSSTDISNILNIKSDTGAGTTRITI